MFIVERDDKPSGPFETAEEAAEWAHHNLPKEGKAWAVRGLNVVQPNIWMGLMYKSFHLGAMLLCFGGIFYLLCNCVAWRFPGVPLFFWGGIAFGITVVASKPP